MQHHHVPRRRRRLSACGEPLQAVMLTQLRQPRPSRLHDRLRYRRAEGGRWLGRGSRRSLRGDP